MKQYEAVIQVMRENGGYATLGHLYQHVPVANWKTKTPYASIRKIVQVRDEFFKIKPGLWALKEFEDRLPEDVQAQFSSRETVKTESSHTYYQGLLVELGNMKNCNTFIPAQDKNRIFLGQPLAEVATINRIHNFGYPRAVSRASTIDVIWFNQRHMPEKMFEVEHSTDIQNSLLKYVDLQDFKIEFYIVADEVRKSLFTSKLSINAFESIRDRVTFLNYEKVAAWHTKTSELRAVEDSIQN